MEKLQAIIVQFYLKQEFAILDLKSIFLYFEERKQK